MNLLISRMRKSAGKIIFIFFTTLFVSITSYAQTDSVKSSPSTEKLLIIGGISAASFIGGYVIQNNIWWKGEKSSFHFNWKNDWNYALGSDKFGHFFLGYSGTNVYKQAFEWSGLTKNESLFYSILVMFAYQTFTEIRDGFSRDYGFSWSDFGANVLGITYPYWQSKFDFLESFNFKISYYPSQRFKDGSNNYIIDDYESTYNWLSIDVDTYLPKKVADVFPAFINLAIGHSVKRLGHKDSHHELFIGLDWDLKDLPGNGWFWNLLKKNINFYHLPAPAVKVYPNTVWYGLKF